MTRRIVDPDGKLAAIDAGAIVVIGPAAELRHAEQIGAMLVVVIGGPAAVDVLRAFVAANEVEATAKALGISRTKAGNLRAALGIAETYTGLSGTTRWRRGKVKTTTVYPDKE